MSVFVQGGRLIADYNAFNDHTIVESDRELPAGECTLATHLRRRDRRTGRIELTVDGQVAGEAGIPHDMRMVSSAGPSIGHDHGSAVSGRYDAPFPYAGTLHEVVIELLVPGGSDASTTARSEMSRQ